MFFHRKELIVPIDVRKPDPVFAQFLLAQFGGATGELTAALQYWVQSFHCPKPGIREMLQDIAVEEFGHLEMVGKLIEEHTRGIEKGEIEAEKNTIFALRGRGPHLLDDAGVSWTAAYINEGGDVVRDLRADIAAEAGARETYEVLLDHATDAGTKKALHYLLTREIAHTKMFMKALESLGKLTEPVFGNVKPDESVNVYYHLSTNGAALRGPWNQEPEFQYVADPVKVIEQHHELAGAGKR
ncbi:MAG TPA: manganese catalase family protein [Acidobacteriaceae bacterium]|jgi:Mn-containing catalase|nr:manganese catalase family protein [Acidobacteriaceae bacterium]